MGRFFATYSIVSLALTVGVSMYAWQTRIQFYPMVIFLCTSKFSVAVLCNLAICATILTFKLVRSVFLGKLRDAEYELLVENSKYAFTETCLALTYFRDELNLKVAGLFIALLVSKIFHWLCKERLAYMESTQNTPVLKHIRLFALKFLLLTVDMAFVHVALNSIRAHGPSVWLLFGFEFLCLVINIYSIFARYGLHLIDLATENGWANKETYVFYLELVAEVARVFVYLAFFLILFTYYGFPIHILRDLYLSVRMLIRRIHEFCNARSITSRMDELFPDATEEELADGVLCIVCRETMQYGTDHVKKLECGHLFHFRCLRGWLERQQACPTCRHPITIRRGATPDGTVRVGQEDGAEVGAGNDGADAIEGDLVEDEGEAENAPAAPAAPDILDGLRQAVPRPAARVLPPDGERMGGRNDSGTARAAPQTPGSATAPNARVAAPVPPPFPPPGMDMPTAPQLLSPAPPLSMGFPPMPGQFQMPNGMMMPPQPPQPPPGMQMPGMPMMPPFSPAGMASPVPPFSPFGFPGQMPFPMGPFGSPVGGQVQQPEASPMLQRSMSAPVAGDRSSQLRAIQSQIEVLEAHLKSLSPASRKRGKPAASRGSASPVLRRAESSPEARSIGTISPGAIPQSKLFAAPPIDDGEQKVGEVESDVPEINIDEERRRREEREKEDTSPHALRRRMAAQAALRRLSSSESMDSSGQKRQQIDEDE
jgi:E3 ubiquitin-protein ligase synoviolin